MALSRRVSSRIRHALVALTMVGIAACTGDRPTGPDASISAAKGGGGGGPKVTSAEPNTAPQETTLDIRVIGSGFEDGSVVKLLLAGNSTPKIVTNSTSFVDGNTLIANITIAIDADIALHDIEVTPPRGRPGVGSELFSVTQKGKPGEEEPEPLFTITTTDLAIDGANVSSVVSGPDGTSLRMVGSANNGAFYWTPTGGLVELTVVYDPGASIKFARAADINEAGQIVGDRFVDRGDPDLNGLQAILWNSSTEPNIDLAPLVRSSFATAINNGGQVVGQKWDFDETPHAMLWSVDGAGNTTTTDLHKETIAGAGFGLLRSAAEDINDRGQVVGRSWDGIRERAFLWDNGVVTMLDGGVDPRFYSFAYTINNADPVQVIGLEHEPGGGSYRALLWTVLSDGTVLTEDLPRLTGFGPGSLSDLNDRGEVVGSASPLNGQGDGHAILWTFNPETGERVVVDLGAGSAQSIDNSASLVGLTRAVGYVDIESGKGKKKTSTRKVLLWEVAPIIR